MSYVNPRTLVFIPAHNAEQRTKNTQIVIFAIKYFSEKHPAYVKIAVKLSQISAQYNRETSRPLLQSILGLIQELECDQGAQIPRPF